MNLPAMHKRQKKILVVLSESHLYLAREGRCFQPNNKAEKTESFLVLLHSQYAHDYHVVAEEMP